MSVTLDIRPSALLKGASLNPTKWRVTLWLLLDNGICFPVHLVSD